MSFKKCSKCSIDKSLDCFYRDAGKKDGLMGVCKDCWKFYQKVERKEYNKNHAKKRYSTAEGKEYSKRYKKSPMGKAVKKKYTLSEKGKLANIRAEFAKVEYELFRHARTRAKDRGLEFNITKEDVIIPTICPVLGVPLYRDATPYTPNVPSLDRIDSNKGYIKGNVRVISLRANILKNNGTIEEFKLILEDLTRIRNKEIL